MYFSTYWHFELLVFREDLTGNLASVEHAKKSLQCVQNLLKRARPSVVVRGFLDCFDGCKRERKSLKQASRDLLFISWSHHNRAVNLVSELRRGAGMVGPLSPSKSSTAKPVSPPAEEEVNLRCVCKTINLKLL